MEDKSPNDIDDKIVAIYFCEENSNGDYEDTIVETGYYHNGEQFVNGRLLYFDRDYGKKLSLGLIFRHMINKRKGAYIWKI